MVGNAWARRGVEKRLHSGKRKEQKTEIGEESRPSKAKKAAYDALDG